MAYQEKSACELTAEMDALAQARLAAIVSSSEDVIISKTLDGIITTWNASATRILGFEAEEMVGQPILRIIPDELAHEEANIMRRIRLGERVEHFDTQRVRKDGSRVHLSLTVSPLRDSGGRIVGASKVARDITERKRAEDLQVLMVRELNHRVKNTLAIVQSIASQSLRRSASPTDFVASFNGRIQSLARAHNLVVQGLMHEASVEDLVQDQVVLGRHDPRIFSAGPAVRLTAESSIDLALVLHELASNARKYGALSVPYGSLGITWRVENTGRPDLVIDWREAGLNDLSAPERRGFGSDLIESTLVCKGGATHIQFTPNGVICQLRLPLNEKEKRLSDPQRFSASPDNLLAGAPSPDHKGRRILIVEDEAIIAMEVAEVLREIGMTIVGPAGTLLEARHLIEIGGFDAALLDANLKGDPVGDLSDALVAKGIPFAFCTGFGRDGLPLSGRDAPILGKPFSQADLETVVTLLFSAVSQTPTR